MNDPATKGRNRRGAKRHGREAFTGALCSLLFLAALPYSVSAKDADAGAFLESLNRQAYAELADVTLSQEQKKQNFRAIFRSAFDVPMISRFVLGRHWRQISEAERQAFMREFEELHMRRFLPLLAEVSEKAIDVKRVQREEARPNLFKVTSLVRRPEGQPAMVVWRIQDNGDAYKVLDIIAEGVSMAITLRQEYGRVAKDRGIQGLIELMREKNAALSQ